MPTVTSDPSHLNFPALIAHERYFQRLRDLASAPLSDPDLLLAEAGALFAQLKAINRATNATTRDHKQRTAEARQAMDHTHLGLQNLMYERRHFEKEIEKCRQFASIYQDIPLYPLEEFVALAPEEARTEDVLKDEHQLMLNRLSFELAERQRLDETYKQLVLERENLLKESREQQVKLEVINSQVERLSKAGIEAQSMVTELLPAKSAPEEETSNSAMDTTEPINESAPDPTLAGTE